MAGKIIPFKNIVFEIFEKSVRIIKPHYSEVIFFNREIKHEDLEKIFSMVKIGMKIKEEEIRNKYNDFLTSMCNF